MIISASRRTDIPAFYQRWFMNRIRAGFLLTRNPFNAHQVRGVSLAPADVDAIVFWTRNPAQLMGALPELDGLGYRYYFQYTITGYPRRLEASVPSPQRAIDTFIALSDRIGPARVVWRYDPILLSNLVDLDEHKRLFSKIAARLAGKTSRVVISFADLYRKTQRNLAAVAGLVYSDLRDDRERLLELAAFMGGVAGANGMHISSCAEAFDMSGAGIQPGKCIDDALLNDLFGLRLSGAKDPGQRDHCGCIKSIDIGAYNTCLHGCSYCYATFSKASVLKNAARHDANSPFLLGGTQGVDPQLLLPPAQQGRLL